MITTANKKPEELGFYFDLSPVSTERLWKELDRCEASPYLKHTFYRYAIVEELKRRKD